MAKKRSSAYWKKRFEQLEQMSHSYGQQTYMEVEPAFTQAQRSIQSEINTWYARFALNNNVTLAEAKRMLSARELAELKWDVNQYIEAGRLHGTDPVWMKQLENASARFHISRLEALQLRTQQALEVAFGNELDAVDRMARKVFTEDYYHSIFEVQKGFNIGWEIGQIDDRELDKVVKKPWSTDGKNFSNRIWSRKQQMINQLHQELTRTLVQGKAPDAAIEHMMKYVDKSVKNAKHAASTLVMTEQAYFHSVSQKEAFNDLDVEEFEVVATLDSHTSEICQDMDGQHFPMTDYEPGVTAPPFHPNCRSVTAPYFEDNYGGQRAARGEDGKTYYVPDNMTYKQWKESMVEGHTEDLKPAEPGGKVKTEAPEKKPETEPSKTRQSLKLANVEYREVQPLKKELTVQEIIDKVGGGDMTKGSCSSLAFTYAGNRNGLDVTDFRGGKSQSIFSHNGNIKEITELAGGQVVHNFNDFKAVNELLQSVAEGKEYYLATGDHAAIIRKIEEHFEYLELQSATNNGWFRLTNDVLKKRFGCKKSHTVHGFRLEAANELIDVESLKDSDEFETLLGYINTAAESQMKGSGGHVK